jgi:hypothetical protein
MEFFSFEQRVSSNLIKLAFLSITITIFLSPAVPRYVIS